MPTQANADMQSCIIGALRAAKANLGNERALGALFDQYFGENFARFPVRRDWGQMSQSDKDNQIAYARGVVVSEATNLAPYASANIAFSASPGNPRIYIGFAQGEKGPRKITIIMAQGCHIFDVQVEGYPHLLSSITDYRRLAPKK